MGTHPIFESDFDCLTDLVRFKSRERGESENEITHCGKWIELCVARILRDVIQRVASPSNITMTMQRRLRNHGTSTSSGSRLTTGKSWSVHCAICDVTRCRRLTLRPRNEPPLQWLGARLSSFLTLFPSSFLAFSTIA